jgi:predicted P-loop ATPase
MGNYDNLAINYSIGTGLSFGRAKNRTDSWAKFKNSFRTPLISPEKFSYYLKLTPDQQVANKAQNGWFYRTQVAGKRRNRQSGMPTNIVTLDFDYATPHMLEMIQMGLILGGTLYFVHSSRRHTPEKPRLRMVIPLLSPLPNEYYPAVSRILASQIDPEMEAVDPVSFRVAQMMFKPVKSSDQEFVFYEQDGEPLDWEALLADFEATTGDWHDLSLLPKVEGEKLRQTSDKAEDPWLKDGPVGTFCRAYTIPEAIDKFLPDVYAESGAVENRYTFLGGTTTDGMEVYDDGRFMYSHHGSDPASDMLVNAFDMVRIHLFGKEDEDIDEDEVSVLKRPSSKSMLEFIAEDDGYRRQHVSDNYDRTAMFDDIADYEAETGYHEEEAQIGGEIVDQEIEDLIGTPKIKLPTNPKGPDVDPDWFSKLEIDPRNGQLASNLPNLISILHNDRRFRGTVEYNELTAKSVTRRPLNTKLATVRSTRIADKVSGDTMDSLHYVKLRAIIETQNGKKKPGYGLKVTDRDLEAAVREVADHWSFHPIRDALTSFVWDGQERLETFFIRYLGVPDTPYFREIAWKWFVAGVARTFEPGHKFDFAVILEGAQGKRKSTMIQIIGLGWGGELKANFHDENKIVEQMLGKFVLELPELSNFNRSSVEDMKAMMAATSNHVRLAWERSPRDYKRQCIFMGSTNKDTYLLDDTGNRRFWPCPVVVEQIDTDAMRKEIGQVWAEAVERYRAMRAVQPEGYLPLALTNAESIAQSLEMQEARRQQTEADSFAPAIREWLDTPYAPDKMEPDTTLIRDRATINDIWSHAMGMQGFPDRSKQIEIGKALKVLGWQKVRDLNTGQGYRGWHYERPDADKSSWSDLL